MSRSSPYIASDGPLRLAVVIKRFVTTGGAERYAVEVTRRLLAAGHHVDIFAREAAPEIVDGCGWHRVPDRWTVSSVLNSHAFAVDAARMLSKNDYDIILSHERGFHQDIATIHTFSYRRGLDQPSFLKRLNDIYLSPRSWLHLRLERQQMAAPWLAPVSDVIRGDIARYYDRQDRVQVITPGVDVHRFDPDWMAAHRAAARRSGGFSNDDVVVLFIGTEFRRKGLDRVIPAIGDGMHLVVVGKGERWNYHKGLVQSCGVTDRVHFEGLSDDVRPYLAAADALVLPSRAEAFGMSVLEAMASGLPVIAGSRAGVAALISDGQNGFLADTSSRIADILATLRDPQYGKRIGAAARETALSHTWDTAAGHYEDLCRQALERRTPPR